MSYLLIMLHQCDRLNYYYFTNLKGLICHTTQ